MIRHLGMLLWVLFASFASGVELVGEPQVSVTGTSVTFKWRTDVACGTRVHYGFSAEQLNQKAVGAVSATHEVTLTQLEAGKTYHYALASAREDLYKGSVTLPGVANAAPPRSSIVSKVVDALTPGPKVSKEPVTKAQPRAPPTRETWGRMDSLQDHYDRHGGDFQSRSPDDYAAQAWFFLQRGRAGEVQMKWDDADETLRVYDPKTRAFAAYNRAGRAKTYFRPNSPTYWQRQPGRPITASQLPF